MYIIWDVKKIEAKGASLGAVVMLVLCNIKFKSPKCGTALLLLGVLQ